MHLKRVISEEKLIELLIKFDENANFVQVYFLQLGVLAVDLGGTLVPQVAAMYERRAPKRTLRHPPAQQVRFSMVRVLLALRFGCAMVSIRRTD